MAVSNEEIAKLLQGMKAEIDLLKGENASMKEKLKEMDEKIPDMESTMAEIQKRNRLAEANPQPVILKKIDSKAVDSEGNVTEEPFTGKINECPFCNHNKKASLLDRTPGGRWACRACGKHWYEDDLTKEYSRQMERGQFAERMEK